MKLRTKAKNGHLKKSIYYTCNVCPYKYNSQLDLNHCYTLSYLNSLRVKSYSGTLLNVFKPCPWDHTWP